MMLPFLIFVALAAALMACSTRCSTISSRRSHRPFQPGDDRRAFTLGRSGRRSDGRRSWRIAIAAGRRRRSGRDAVAGVETRMIPLSSGADWRDPELRRVLVLMGPGTLGVAATQVTSSSTAARHERGHRAVSWRTYAFRLTPTADRLSSSRLRPRCAERSRVTRRSTPGRRPRHFVPGCVDADLSVPATVGLIVLAQPIVQLLFQHGRFLAADTTATAAAVRFYALG